MIVVKLLPMLLVSRMPLVETEKPAHAHYALVFRETEITYEEVPFLHVGKTGFDTGDPVRASPARIDLVVAAAMAGDYAVELEGDVRGEFVEIPGLAEQGDEVERRPEVVTAERFHPVRPHAATRQVCLFGISLNRILLRTSPQRRGGRR